MSDIGDLHRRTVRLEQQVRALADPADDHFVMVMGSAGSSDPRVIPLIAAARTAGRHLVWVVEDEHGDLYDWENDPRGPSFARDDAEADRYARENLGLGCPVTPRQ